MFHTENKRFWTSELCEDTQFMLSGVFNFFFHTTREAQIKFTDVPTMFIHQQTHKTRRVTSNGDVQLSFWNIFRHGQYLRKNKENAF
jgi:hypothetical protein